MKISESRHIVDIENQPEPILGAYRPPFTRLMNNREDAFEAYRLFSEAGLNMVVDSDSILSEKFGWVIEACEKYGVKIFESLPEAFYTDEPEKSRASVEKLLSTPAFYALI